MKDNDSSISTNQPWLVLNAIWANFYKASSGFKRYSAAWFANTGETCCH